MTFRIRLRGIASAILWRLSQSMRRAARFIKRFLPNEFTSNLEKVGLREPETADDLHHQFASRTGDWVIIACFAYRIAVPPVNLIGGLSAIGRSADRYVPLVIGLMLWNMLLIAAVLNQRSRTLLARWSFFAVDVSLAVGANLWSAAVLPGGTFLQPYHDVFWTYAMGTVAVWAALKGTRMGLILVTCGNALLLGMIYINGASLAAAGAPESILSRLGWLLSGVPLPVIVQRLGHQGTGLGNAEGQRAGRALERVRALRAVHDTILQALAQIAQYAVATDTPLDERTQYIHELADQQLQDLGRVLRADDRNWTGLIDGLQSLVRRFALQNLTVEVIVSDLASDPPKHIADSLLSATQEALTNVRKHAQVNQATVRAETTGRGWEVWISDQGSGFDTTISYPGIGIPESIRQRISEIGGRVQISSRPGSGTQVRLLVDFGSARKAGGVSVAGGVARALTPPNSTSIDALTNQALAWFVVAALVYRISLSPLQAASLFTILKPGRAWPFLVAIAGVFTFDLALLAILISGKFSRLFQSPILLIVDLGLTAMLNLWSSYAQSPSLVLVVQHEVLWGYTLGVAAFWTGLRGARVGLAIVFGGFILQLGMIRVNHAEFHAAAWRLIATQEGWLIAAFAISWLLAVLARRSAQQAVREGIETGLAIERAWVLRDVYDDARKSLSAILQKSQSPTTQKALMEVRGTALDEVDRLRAFIDRDRRQSHLRMADELRQLARSHQSHGLRVELVTSQLTSDPPDHVARGLLAAASEALQNVVDYASTPHAVVRASNSYGSFEITIRDHGHVSSSQGHPNSSRILQHMIGIGGQAEIWSEPGHGTRIRLVWRPENLG